MKRKRTMAEHGEKTIRITIRFWTNNISKKPGYVVKKECWDKGVVNVGTNKAHGLKMGKPIHFNSFMDIPSKIARLLKMHNIKLHRGHNI